MRRRSTLTREESQLMNLQLLDALQTRGMEKKAYEAFADYTKLMLREEGFWRKWITVDSVVNSDLDRRVDTTDPYIVEDMEPGCPPAASVPFDTLPQQYYLRGPRYASSFCRVLSPEYYFDSIHLRTYKMDIRTVVTDNAIRDIMSVEDGDFISALNFIMGDAADATSPMTGYVQWVNMNVPIDRNGIEDMKKILPRMPGHLTAQKALVNNVSIYEFQKWDRAEAGGDLSQDLLKEGFADAEFAELQWTVTIKRDLVPDGTVFLMAGEDYVGKGYELEPVTMVNDAEGPNVRFYNYECIGGAIGNGYGIGRADFLGV